MFFVRQGATHKIVIGPVVAVANGYVPVTTLDLTTADEKAAILHDNGTVVSISAYTFAAIASADGYYHLTLQSGISNTVGHVTIVINDDSLCLPVKAEYTVVEEAVYDALYAASAPGYVTNQPVDVNTIKTQTVTCAAGVTVRADVGAAGTPGAANGMFIAGTNAATTITSATGNALTLSSTGANGHGLAASGNGSGMGVRADGGATGSGAYLAGGGTSGHGLTLAATGATYAGLSIAAPNGIRVVPTNGIGLEIQDDGTYPSIHLYSNGSPKSFVADALVEFDALTVTGTTTLTGAVSAPAGITANITGNLSGSVGSLTTNNDKTGYSLTATTGLGNQTADITGTLSTVTTLTNLPAITANWLTAAGTAADFGAEIADAVHDEQVDGTTTFRESTRLQNAALAGKASGLATTTAVYRDLADTKDRLTATVDADGNRTAVTRDAT